MISLDPILKQIKSAKTLHKGGFRYDINNKEAVTPLNKVESAIEISMSTISEFDLGMFCQSFYEFTVKQIGEMHNMIYQTIDAVSALTGNIVKGKPVDAETILEMLEKKEMAFDRNGEPIIDQLITNDQNVYKKLVAMKFTPEQEERRKQIIERKKKEYYAKKRYRRLSYID